MLTVYLKRVIDFSLWKRLSLMIKPILIGIPLSLLYASPSYSLQTLELRPDSSLLSMLGERKAGSHVRLYLPNLPYIATSHAMSAGLVRPANNEVGWEYDVALSHRVISPRVFEFSLRKNVRFQDGSPFDADSVLLNMKYFKKDPFTFSKIHLLYDHVEKVDQHTVRFYFKEDYGFFLYDAMWLHFYTPEYLELFGWNGKPLCPALAASGPYSLGPFILEKGYIEGDRRTSKAELVANPYYWDPEYPKVERITIYTDKPYQEALESVLNTDGEVDLVPIQFSEELPTILGPYSKLVRSPSTNIYNARFNLISGHPLLQDIKVREALNRAIDQESLVQLSMNGEGQYSAIGVGVDLVGVKEASAHLTPYSLLQSPLDPNVRNELIQIIKEAQVRLGYNPDEPLPLTLLAQRSLHYVLKDVKYFFEQIHVKVTLEIVETESEMFANVLGTKPGTNPHYSDIIFWANFDWIRNPWNTFFIYPPDSIWSAFEKDDKMGDLLDQFIKTPISDDNYISVLTDTLNHIHQQKYVLFLPSPNVVLAFNKEISFNPRTSSIYPLWEIEVSDQHWSVRDEPYPDALKQPVAITNANAEVK